MSERDYCVKKDFSTPRDEKRIPIICNLIKTLWTNYRENNNLFGFYYITNLIEIEGKKEQQNNSSDPFYWEDDKWYDKLQEMISQSSNFKKKEILTENDLKNIDKTIQCFEDYWNLYTDLRLMQILEIFDEVVEEKLRDSNFTDSDFWTSLLGGEQIRILNNSIQHLKEQKSNVENGTDDIFKGKGNNGTNKLKQIYLSQLEQLIQKSQKKLEKTKKEYDV